MNEKMLKVLECVKAIDDSDAKRGLQVLKDYGFNSNGNISAVDFVDKLIDDMIFELKEV